MTPCPGSHGALLMTAAELMMAVPGSGAPQAVQCCRVSLALAAGERGEPWPAWVGWAAWDGLEHHPKVGSPVTPVPLCCRRSEGHCSLGLCMGSRGARPRKAPALGCCPRLAICSSLWPLPEQEQVLCLGSSKGLCLPQWLGWYFSHCW